ncbi:hypothetical protein K2X33_03040 [bacterium]|nr:hypothetical protein [bacterium]
MQINLEPHQEQAIEAAIRAGRFRSLEEFIESAVRTLAPAEPPESADPLEPSALIHIDGLWVHRGQPEAGARWDQLIDDVRQERLSDLLRASYP